MTSQHIDQAITALLAATTPLLVVLIAIRVASSHARSVGQAFQKPSSVGRLGQITAVLAIVAGTAALFLPAPSVWIFAVGGVVRRVRGSSLAGASRH